MDPKGEKDSRPASAKTTTADPVQLREPLVSHIFTADPSAHVFEGQIYVYPSHDRETNLQPSEDDDGAHFDMVDYHVLSLRDFTSPVIDHGPVLHVRDVPWAEKQLWAPDAAYYDGTYYLVFPAKDRAGVFRIGVATSKSPAGPFTARPEPIPGSYSIDPAVFVDDDRQIYLYFGGLWGGQLERWQSGKYDAKGARLQGDVPALKPRVARLNADLSGIVGGVHEAAIVDAAGAPLRASDTERRFFEAAWVHKRNGTYYLSYSTGDTHLLVYATSASPLGPFVFRGTILRPVIGWTTHHSIVEFKGRWYLFYHDSSLSNGATNLRCVKVTELEHEADGTIRTIQPYA
jgi:glycosyl hydrolase family 43